MQLFNHDIARLRFLVAVFAIFWTVHSHATAIVVVIGASGNEITIATDSKGVLSVGRFGPNETPPRITKLVVVNDRIAIASLGKAFARFALVNGQTFNYDFATWVAKIKSGLPEDVSFDALVKTTTDEMLLLVPNWQSALQQGLMNRQDPDDLFEPLTECVIVGYRGGTPLVSIVETYIDWEGKRVLGPYQITYEPNPMIRVTGQNRVYTFGIKAAGTNFDNPESYAYKQAMIHCPNAIKDYMNRRPLSVDESNSLARFLIEVEEDTNPQQVGGRVNVVNIPLGGRAHSLSVDAPKRLSGKQESKPK